MSNMSEVTEFKIPDGVMAMTDDEGVVVTLYQNDPEHGGVFRHDGAWVPLVDPTTLTELAFVGVQDSAVALFDEHEASGNLVPIKFYTPTAEGPYWTDAIPLNDDEVSEDVEDESEEEIVVDEEPLAASVTLNTVDDLTAAIAAANDDPDLRWYVERRVAALGLEASLPWLEG